jgi:alpha-amylase/alpha-mannosidase (GH57 family)
VTQQYVCIHGHFYQPPRENPWLGVIEVQPGAKPFHDWNERITAECYAACARARIHNDQRQIDRLANNFLNISFNIGPTLLHWLERHHASTLKRIIAADRVSCERLEGHGNAMAQTYNHVIMPLASVRDQHTQIRWGIADFEHYYGRRPEGMWLSECAVDRSTVRALIDHGIRFIVLSPRQAGRVRHLQSQEWHKVHPTQPDTRWPYRIFDRQPDGSKDYSRHLDVFFYNDDLSQAIAFQHLLRDAGKMNQRVLATFDPHIDAPQLVSIGTDGESYGHHEPYGEMCLAYFYEFLVKENNESITNYAHFLSLHPPQWEVELWEGERGEGSSWSCAHGVDRWYRDCGCSDGGMEGWNQAWRTPLRESFDELRVELDAIFEKEGGCLFHDPWEARDEYIAILLDSCRERRAAFLQRHLHAEPSDANVTQAWTLLAMQHYGMLMYTSCAWFFADVARVEPEQNMRYALRAAQFAQPFTETDLEAQLISGLEEATSNEEKHGTGGHVFRKTVRPSAYPEETVAACYVMMEMYELVEPPFSYHVEYHQVSRESREWMKAFRGQILVQDRDLFTTTRYAFIAAHLSDREASCLVRPCLDEAQAERLLAGWEEMPASKLGSYLRAEGQLIRDMPYEQRQQLLDHVLAARIAAAQESVSSQYDEIRPLLAILSENKMEPPEILRVSAEYVLSERFKDVCANLAARSRWDEDTADRALALLEEADLYKLEINKAGATPTMGELVVDYMDRLIENPTLSIVQEVIELHHFCMQAGLFFENGGKVENRYWYLLRHRIVPLIHRLRQEPWEGDPREKARGEELVKRIYRLGLELNFSETHMDHLLAFIEHAEPDEGER